MRLPPEVADLPSGSRQLVRVGALEVLVCNVAGEFFAFQNRCPHQDFSLEDARLRGHVIECSLHGGRFDVRDGCPTRAPTAERLVRYPVHVLDDRVEIEIPEPGSSP
jgi:nitrite reductase/ring-hydroxylating ferredoxin subunit